VSQRERGRTPAGFRTQLLQRLRNEALRTGVPAQRLQQRIAFERLLARLPRDGEWVLKGGFALQFRYGLQARPTRDVDLRTALDPAAALDRLRRVVTAATATDNFTFEFGEVAQEMQGAPGGSLRVRVVTRVAAATEQVEADRLSRSVEATFAVRGTHPIPERLPEPPASWAQPFASLAAEAVKLPTTDLLGGHALAAQFWDPFLADRAVHHLWLPDQRRWSIPPAEPVDL
jgi:hypothetical protein